MGAYAETQDELTAELADLKDKYREVVGLLRDSQEELKRNRRGTGGAGATAAAKGGCAPFKGMLGEGAEERLRGKEHS